MVKKQGKVLKALLDVVLSLLPITLPVYYFLMPK